MKKAILVVFLLLICFSSVHALEVCTPSLEYQKYMALSDEEKELYIEPPYCKEVIEGEDSDKTDVVLSIFKAVNYLISASSTDAAYNARNDGYINNSQAQGNLGTCWAFSSISAVEANAKKNGYGTYDFSEAHMIYSVLSVAYSDEEGQKGKYYTTNFDGGKVTFAASYYFNDFGQLLERDMPYRDSEAKITSSDYRKGNKMISLGGFSLANVGNYGVCSSDEIAYIKRQIVSSGSVQSSMYMDEGLFKDMGNDYYLSTLSNSSLPNHGITIIGWDDSIPASSFNGASRNGAFIIKNSWGPSWSNDGLFYISYDDHFICKNTATFYDVSTKTFDNTYSSSDMLGVPSFTFSGTFYTSAKFNKKTSNNESIKRVSFPVGLNSSYTVYLSSDNNINSTSNWRQLTSGTSDAYGIKSVDVNIPITSDFTIIVKYGAPQSTSIFTMCNNVSDTSKMESSSNRNFYSANTNNWYDMSDISVSGNSIGCEPNIYVYTDNVANQPTEQSITINSINESNNSFIVSIINTNVNTSDINYKIYNSSNNDVTSLFNISPNYSSNKITITSNGKISGKFSFVIKYGSKEAKTNFEYKESITSLDSSFVTVSSNRLVVSIPNNYTLTYQALMSKLSIKNTEITVYDSKGSKITSNSAKVATNSKVKLNNNTYLVIVLGDINEDGNVTALDYIEVKKHLIASTIKDNGKLLACDVDKNGSISSSDYIAIKNILMR